MKIHNPFRTALVATLGVGLGILMLGSLENLSTVLLYIGTALFLSLGIDPAVRWLERRKLPHWAAVLIAVLALLLIFAGIIAVVLPLIVSQATQLIEQITEFVNRPNLLAELQALLAERFPGLDVELIIQQAQDWLIANVGGIGNWLLSASLSVAGGFFGVFIVLILTIYFTASMPSLLRSVHSLVPASRRERFTDLSEQITDSVGHYVLGQVSLGAINGVLSFIYLNIIQAPFPAVLAVIAFTFSLIPLVGTLTGSAIIVLMCLIPGIGGSVGTAIAAGIYYLIYMQVEAYVIAPRIMNRAVSVPGALVVVAALSGGTLLGLLGALIAIPVAASLLIIYRQVVIPRMEER